MDKGEANPRHRTVVLERDSTGRLVKRRPEIMQDFACDDRKFGGEFTVQFETPYLFCAVSIEPGINAIRICSMKALIQESISLVWVTDRSILANAASNGSGFIKIYPFYSPAPSNHIHAHPCNSSTGPSQGL